MLVVPEVLAVPMVLVPMVPIVLVLKVLVLLVRGPVSGRGRPCPRRRLAASAEASLEAA